MVIEILLAVIASLFTATSSVAQRVAAAPAPGEISFSWRLVVFLVRRPIWFLGILCMIAGFLFQLAALRVGDLSLVQPVIATELLFVFIYLAARNRHGVQLRDWVAAVGMAVGLGAFLFLADPSGGDTAQATAWMWILAGSSIAAGSALMAVIGMVSVRGHAPSPARKAAFLSVSAGITWGFVAAVIKELSAYVDHGWYAVFSNWSPYVLVLSGAVGMFIVSNAFQAGPLAASQPGLTIVDPLVASLLGVTLFGEHLHHGPFHLAGEAVAVAVLVASVILLTRSPLIHPPVREASVDASPKGATDAARTEGGDAGELPDGQGAGGTDPAKGVGSPQRNQSHGRGVAAPGAGP